MDGPIVNKSPMELQKFIDSLVEIKLIKDYSYIGFVKSIDPITGSIVLSVPTDDHYQSVLIPGHAVLYISTTEDSSLSPPNKIATEKPPDEEYIMERKNKILDWFKINLIPIQDRDGILKVGDVDIVPPYRQTDIYAKNLIVYSNIHKLIENMPQ